MAVKLAGILIILTFLSSAVWAEDSPASPLAAPPKLPNEKTLKEQTEDAPNYSPFSAERSVRLDRKIGVMVGLLADPLPTWFGFHVAFNTFDFGRLRASYGTTLGNVQAWGGGYEVLAPGWNLSPTIGLSYTSFAVSTASTSAVLGVNPGGSAAYWCASVGMDYQAPNGAQVGIGYQLSLAGTGGNPYLHAGWFFDWF